MADADLETSFRHDEWLRAFPLTPATALDYFAWSPWYEPDCVNEVAKAQGLGPDAARHLTGTEYALRRCAGEPRLFIVERRRRTGVDECLPVGVYMILEGTVYPVPDMLALAGGRVARAAHHLALSAAHARAHYEEVAAGAGGGGAAAGGGGTGGGGGGSAHVDRLLLALAQEMM